MLAALTASKLDHHKYVFAKREDNALTASELRLQRAPPTDATRSGDVICSSTDIAHMTTVCQRSIAGSGLRCHKRCLVSVLPRGSLRNESLRSRCATLRVVYPTVNL